MEKDHKDLRRLAIFYYVFAVFSLAGVLVTYFLISVAIRPMLPEADNLDPDAQWALDLMENLITGLEIFSIALSSLAALLSVLNARFLVRHTHRRFCFAVALFACLSMPVGTILGVFTIATLNRDSVKALFAGQAAPSPDDAP